MKNKSVIHLCLIAGLILLVAQLSLLAVLLFPLEKFQTYPIHDLQSLVNITSRLNLPILTIDSEILHSVAVKGRQFVKECTLCKGKFPITFAVMFRGLESNFGVKLLHEFQRAGFQAEIFLNLHPSQKPRKMLSDLSICYLLKKETVIHLVLIHEREGNYWWYGDLHSDPLFSDKLSTFGLSLSDVHLMKTEGALEKLNTELVLLDGIPFLVPKDISRFVRDASTSRFQECNHTRAHSFHLRYGKDTTHDALRFSHRAWKLLSRAKTILDKLRVRFWLSSGTCLGYFRQCDIIPYSRDVDIGIFITDYSDSIIPEFVAHGFTLKHWFGRVNDSLEISFVTGDIKLDLFFFYEEGPWLWNGGTEVGTGKKFKYLFPRFTLCWTEFMDLKVRVPCDTQTYIEANYGKDWFTPVSEWDWRSSAANVHDNGVWPEEEWPQVIQVKP